jgi:hypothetical protein
MRDNKVIPLLISIMMIGINLEQYVFGKFVGMKANYCIGQ